MSRVNNKDTRTTPFAYLAPCSSVSIAGWEDTIPENKYYLKEKHSFFKIRISFIRIPRLKKDNK